MDAEKAAKVAIKDSIDDFPGHPVADTMEGVQADLEKDLSNDEPMPSPDGKDFTHGNGKKKK